MVAMRDVIVMTVTMNLVSGEVVAKTTAMTEDETTIVIVITIEIMAADDMTMMTVIIDEKSRIVVLPVPNDMNQMTKRPTNTINPPPHRVIPVPVIVAPLLPLVLQQRRPPHHPVATAAIPHPHLLTTVVDLPPFPYIIVVLRPHDQGHQIVMSRPTVLLRRLLLVKNRRRRMQ